MSIVAGERSEHRVRRQLAPCVEAAVRTSSHEDDAHDDRSRTIRPHGTPDPLSTLKSTPGACRMTLIVDRHVRAGPATHAIVIGVGTYPWLLGGSRARPASAEGMGQLASPPRSAIAFAEWVRDSHLDPSAPLATVDLLVSDGKAAVDYTRPDGSVVTLEIPTKAAIAAALRLWKQRGAAHDGDLLIFFFCGHGVARGFQLALLAQDFGSDEEQPFNGAIWFEGMREGMRNGRATRQIYFVDACRVGSENLLRDYVASLDAVFSARAPFTVDLAQSVYYATTTGQSAYGRPGETSLFTRNLLLGLQGLAANDDRGDWRIETTKLQRVLTELSREFALPEHFGLQSPTSGEQVSFDLHRLRDAPIVPLFMQPSWSDEDDLPPTDIRSVEVFREGARAMRWLDPWETADDCSWETGRFRSDQTAGMRYSWSVTFADGTRHESPLRTLNPPFRLVEVTENGFS